MHIYLYKSIKAKMFTATEVRLELTGPVRNRRISSALQYAAMRLRHN